MVLHTHPARGAKEMAGRKIKSDKAIRGREKFRIASSKTSPPGAQ
jgi:hypothetical protein